MSGASELPASRSSLESPGPSSCHESGLCAADQYTVQGCEANSQRKRHVKESRKRAWTDSEDARLEQLVQARGAHSWPDHAKALAEQDGQPCRTGKSCRLRWWNHLDPGLKRTAFSTKENAVILEAHRHLGNKWAAIARYIGRTDNSVKNHWHSNLSGRKRRGPDATSQLLQATAQSRQQALQAFQQLPDTVQSLLLSVAQLCTSGDGACAAMCAVTWGTEEPRPCYSHAANNALQQCYELAGLECPADMLAPVTGAAGWWPEEPHTTSPGFMKTASITQHAQQPLPHWPQATFQQRPSNTPFWAHPPPLEGQQPHAADGAGVQACPNIASSGERQLAQMPDKASPEPDMRRGQPSSDPRHQAWGPACKAVEPADAQGWQGHVEADQLLTSEPAEAYSSESPCKPGMQHGKKAVQIQANLPHTPSKGQEPIRSWSIAA